VAYSRGSWGRVFILGRASLVSRAVCAGHRLSGTVLRCFLWSHFMKVSKKTPARQRAVLVGGLAASVLGRYRATGAKSFTARQMASEFPRFNAAELAQAVDELLENELVTQSGHEAAATYTLTEQGLTGRVGVA
jgi:hypothetical protein